jgi:hypothetical protein
MTDVSRQSIGRIFKVQTLEEGSPETSVDDYQSTLGNILTGEDLTKTASEA